MTELLKKNWERIHQAIKLDTVQAQKLLNNYSCHKITKLLFLSTGCANSNYRLSLENGEDLLLRVYTRHIEAIYIEQHVENLVKKLIPCPAFLYIDTSYRDLNFAYAFMEYKSGVLFRDLIISNNHQAIQTCSYEAGKYLAQLRKIKLPVGGLFTSDGTIKPFTPQEKFLPLCTKLLSDKNISSCLGLELHEKVENFLEVNKRYIPDEHDTNLCHGDFDPANVLVEQNDTGWHITAILDWEFSFSSSYLFDVGMWLRFSHRLPPSYETSFIKGLEAYDELPHHWKESAQLMDLLCLLQLLSHSPEEDRPILNKDVVSLIKHKVAM